MDKILDTIKQILIILFILFIFWIAWGFVSKLKNQNSVEITNVNSKWEKDADEENTDYLSQEAIKQELEKLK